MQFWRPVHNEPVAIVTSVEFGEYYVKLWEFNNSIEDRVNDYSLQDRENDCYDWQYNVKELFLVHFVRSKRV